MPLEFQSVSHGIVAFGFFNVETDLLLLNQFFFFADDFCSAIIQVARTNGEDFESPWDVYQIDPNDIGNLVGAIHAFDLRGFIGEVYKLFPFPKEQQNFKQNPQGFRSRPTIEKLIQTYGKKIILPFAVDLKHEKISIGEYVFNKAGFMELIRYVWMGGFPRWKDEVRPDYVLAMREEIEKSKNPLFDGVVFTP